MLLDHDLDPQVAPRSARIAQLALIAQLEPHAALDAGGDVDLEVSGASERARRPGNWGRGR